MDPKEFADFLKDTDLPRFNEFRDGLNRKNGRSWPRDATTFAEKSAFLLPVIDNLVRGSSEKAQELTRILKKHAKRNIQ